MVRILFNTKTYSKDIPMRNNYPALDGLRGLAILMIIQYHNFAFPIISKFSWIGVDLFFVLSGFLITEILLRTRSSRKYLRNFYARRILRIFPIYYSSIVLFLFLLPRLITYPIDLNYFISHLHWFLLEMQNWLFIFSPGGNNNFLNHFWTLALEEQFYLISPWIILFVKPAQKMISFLLVLIIVAISLRVLLWSLHFKHFSYVNLFTFTRIDGLCVGSLLAVLKFQGNIEFNKLNKRLLLMLFGIILVILPVYKFFFPERLPFVACCVYPAVAAFCGGAVWFAIRSGNLLSMLLTNKVLMFFGRISYGLYIFHWPIYILLSKGVGNLPASLVVADINVLQAIAATLIAILLATLSFYGFEQHFLKLKRYFVE